MCDVPQIRNGDNGGAKDILVVNEIGVGGGVGVALSLETKDFGIFSGGFDGDDAVGDDGFVVVCDVGDDVADLEGFIVGRFDVNEGADGEFGLHGAGHDGKGFEAGDFDTDESKGDDDD